MEKKEALAGTLVVSGTASIVASVLAGTGLDSMYILWSALTFPHRQSELMLGGAPISLLSPILIWAGLAFGGVLVALGLRIGLRGPRRPKAEPANGQRTSDDQAVEETLRAWQKKR